LPPFCFATSLLQCSFVLLFFLLCHPFALLLPYFNALLFCRFFCFASFLRLISFSFVP
jgi:hypothetical protein